MKQHKTDFKQRMIYCVIAMFGVVMLGAITSKYLDSSITPITLLVSHSSEAPQYPQKIAVSLSILRGQPNQSDYNINKDKLKETLKKIDSRIAVSEDYFERFPRVDTLKEEHLAQSAMFYPTKGEVLKNFLIISYKISNYFDNSHSHGEPISPEIKKDIRHLLELSQNEISEILSERTMLFNQHVKDVAQEILSIRFCLIIFFTLLIFCIIAILFYPLHTRSQNLINAMDRQKEHFETERNRLYLASKATTTGIWDWDVRTGGFYWNDVLKDILGLGFEKGNAYDTDYFQSLLHPDDKDNFNQDIKEHFVTKNTFTSEARVMHSNGQYIWARFKGQALWNDEGKAFRMTGSLQNYTEAKETEIQRETFIQGIEAANIAFAIIDMKTDARHFTYASPAFCETTSYEFEKLTHSNMAVFTGPETSMGDLDRIDYALKNKENLSLKMISYRYDGTPYHNKITLRPIFFNQQFSNYFIVIFNDLTDEIKNQKQEIERQRNESLGSLAGSVAHEINNLLMPMTMAEDILEDELKDDCDPFAREQIATIVEYANQAKEIVNGILTFSRKETGNLKRVKLHDELSGAVQFIRNLLSSKTTLTLHTTDHVDVEAMVNQTEMKQIITNLCKNAEQAFYICPRVPFPETVLTMMCRQYLDEDQQLMHFYLFLQFLSPHS